MEKNIDSFALMDPQTVLQHSHSVWIAQMAVHLITVVFTRQSPIPLVEDLELMV